jgi:O-antigen/teichoic acid export membrane protein
LFSGKGFEGAAPIMRILSPNIIFAVMNGFLAYQIFIPFGKELYTCIATFVGAILNVVLNSIFIITFGTRGAAVATVLAEISVFIILMYYMKKFYQDKTLFKEVWKYLVAGICMFIVGLGIAALGLGLILKILVTVVICIICYFGVLMILKAKIAFVVIDMLKARIKRK